MGRFVTAVKPSWRSTPATRAVAAGPRASPPAWVRKRGGCVRADAPPRSIATCRRRGGHESCMCPNEFAGSSLDGAYASPPRGSLEGARDPVAHPTGSAGALVIRVCADPFPRTPLPTTRGPRRDEPGRTTYGYGSSSGLLGQECPRTQFLRPVAVACVAAPRFAELVLFAPVGRRRAWITLRPRLRWCSQRCAWPPTRWPSPAGRRRGGSTPNARRDAPHGACARRASSPRSRR